MALIGPEKQPQYRASFEYMILPQAESNISVTNPRGPYSVEVWAVIDEFGREGQWMARLLPGEIAWRGRRFKTHEEAQSFAESLFKSRISPWVEHVPVKAKQETLFSHG